jgi:Flp pilus assembly pilin Flp
MGVNRVKDLIGRFIREEDGLGTVEIVVLIAVLVGIALIFRDAIIKFVTGIMKSVFAPCNFNSVFFRYKFNIDLNNVIIAITIIKIVFYPYYI